MKKQAEFWFPALLCFSLFWLLRSQHFAGDGMMISRITEGGKWLVKNELLSQVVLQLAYSVFSFCHITPMETMNALSCIGGVSALWVLLRFGEKWVGLPPHWPLFLFFSSGFFIYACGHTEYYPILLPLLWYYGYCGIGYLRGECRPFYLALVFVLACGLHFAMLIALPSLLLLPFGARRMDDYKPILLGLLLLIPLVLIRNYPEILGHKAAGLSPAWNVLPWFPYPGMYRHYAFFEWGHGLDWLYAWSRRSWFFWPLIVWCLFTCGVRSTWNWERIFLWVYTLCFTGWTTFWHPDLGMENDWDLFAIESAPCLLLLLSYLPWFLSHSYRRATLLLLCSASALIQYSYIVEKADIPRLGYGGAVIQPARSDAFTLSLDGFFRPPILPRLREGTYSGKYVDQTHRRAYDFYVVIVPEKIVEVMLDNPCSNGRNQGCSFFQSFTWVSGAE